MGTHKHIILAGRIYSDAKSGEGSRFTPLPFYSQEQYAPMNIDAMREKEHSRSEVGIRAEAVNESDKQTPDDHSQESRLETPIKKQNPDYLPCRMLETACGRKYCLERCEYFDNCIRGGQ